MIAVMIPILLATWLSSAAAPASKPWLAWKWDRVLDAHATPNILDAPQDGFMHLSPSSADFQPGWPAAWVAKLLAMPLGQRGFILRDYDVGVDPFRNPADGRSLWWQHGIAGAANKTRYIACTS